MYHKSRLESVSRRNKRKLNEKLSGVRQEKKEILVCITENDDGTGQIIWNESTCVKTYNDTEPVFNHENGKVYLADNIISVDPNVWGRKE